MKKITLVLVFMMVTALGNAQSHHWANQLAGTSTVPFDVKIKDIVPLTDNELYIVGSFSGTVDFDFSSNVNNVVANGTDAFVARYNDSRELVWLYTTNTAGGQDAIYALANSVNSSLTQRINVVFTDNNNSFTIKSFNKDTGAILSSTLDNLSTGTIKINDLELDPATNVFYVSGSFSGSCDFSGTTDTSAGQQDAFCAAFTLTTTGAFSYTTHSRYGGTANEEVMDAAFDKATNNLVIVGNYEGTCDFDITTPGVFTRASLGGKDGFIFKCTNTNLKPTSNSAIQVYSGSNFSSADCAVVHNNQLMVGTNFIGTVQFNPNGNSWLETVSHKTYNISIYFDISTNFIVSSGYSYTTNSSFEFLVSKLFLNAANNSVYIIQKSKWNAGVVLVELQKRGFPNYTTGSQFDRRIQLSDLTSDSVIRNNESIDAFYFAGHFLGGTADLNAGTAPPETDLYTAIGSTNNGFISKWASCLTVADVPVIQGGNTTLCAGQPVSLNIGTTPRLNSRSVWKWYSGTDCNGVSIGTGSSITVNPIANTDYFVRAEGGCVANNTPICSTAKTVLVNTVSNLTTITGNSISSNEVGGIYQWYDCDTGSPISGATNQVYFPTVGGDYRVTVISAAGCGPATSDCAFISLGLDDFTKLGFKLYPNPVQNNFIIEGDSELEKVTLYNLLGQRVKSFTQTTNTFDMSEVTSGTYLVEVQTSQGKATTRIIKQ